MTCLPARMHCSACCACSCVGEHSNRGFDAGLRQRLGQVGRAMRNLPFLGDLGGGRRIAADQRHHFDAVDLRHRLQVFDAEGAGTDQNDFHGLAGMGCGPAFSSIRCPIAVLEAGT